jgi:N-acetylglucosamine-6-phosphate deacetylase
MNATGRLPAPGGTRDFGPDEYCFKELDVYCELISDSIGIHVNREMQQLLVHVKGYQRVILITDSTSFNNPTPEKYKNVTDINFDKWGGIAGSKLTLDVACRNVMSHTNCGIAQAFCMASTNPAKLMGIYDERGSVAKGKIADLVFVDDMFNVKCVMLDGEIVK